MALDFNGSSDKVEGAYPAGFDTSAVTSTIAAWFFQAGSVSDGTIAGIVDASEASSSADFHRIRISGTDLIAQSENRIASIGTVTADTWHHAVGLFVDTDSRFAFLDGTKSSVDNNTTFTDGLDEVNIGYIGFAAGDTDFFNGIIAEFGMWDVALTDREVAALAAGASPLMIRLDALIYYVPLIRTVHELRHGSTLTVTGTTPLGHAPIVYPFTPPVLKMSPVGTVIPPVGAAVLTGLAGIMDFGVITQTTIKGT